MGQVNDWLTDIITGFFTTLISGALTLLGDLLNNIFTSILEANNSLLADTSFAIIEAAAVSLLALMAAKQLFSVYILQTAGDADQDPVDYIYRISIAVALITCNGWIFDFLMGFASDVTDYFTQISASTTDSFSVSITNLIALTAGVTVFNSGTGVCVVLLALLLVIGVILFIIQAAIRGAELILMKVLFPVFACDYVTTDRERWNTFFQSYLITFLGYGIQVFCFNMFLAALAKAVIDMNGAAQISLNMLVAGGWMVLMIRAPKWLEKYCYASGVGTSVKGVLRMAPTSLMYLRR